MKTVYQCIAAALSAIVFIGLLVLIFPPKKARAAEEAAAVRLTNERCQLEAVTNLPFRATWDEPGKHFEGCWGRHRRSPSVYLTYWEDKTVIAIPVEEVAPAGARPGLNI